MVGKPNKKIPCASLQLIPVFEEPFSHNTLLLYSSCVTATEVNNGFHPGLKRTTETAF
jgi:hypothetical protein